MATPLVYLILGSKGTGQFQVLTDLIDFGAAKEERTIVYCSENDLPEARTDLKVRSREAKLETYQWDGAAIELATPEAIDLIFIVADGLADPADFVEAFHGWLSQSACELGRIMTVLDSEMAIARHDAFAWYDCCVHFSDVVLLAKRDNVSNKQMKDFLDHYEEECFPCLFEYVKKGRVSNPSLLLEPQPRRISRIFDEPEVFEDDEESDVVEEEVAGDPSKDAFLKRISGGRRERTLPKIADHL